MNRIPIVVGIMLTTLPLWAAEKALPTEPADIAPTSIEAKQTTESIAKTVTQAVTSYEPLLSWAWDDVSLEIPLSMTTRFEATNRYPLDAHRSLIGSGPQINPQARVAMRLNTGRALKIVNLYLDLEQDLFAGDLGWSPEIEGAGLPATARVSHTLRKAWARFAFGRYLHLAGGLNTGDWGMGLVANGGDRYWEPGSARFTDPRGGDRVLRGTVASGPHTDWNMIAALNYDKVIEDDALLTGAELDPSNPERYESDQAHQLSGALILGYNQPYGAGIYAARRTQTDWRGGETQVWVLDATARAEHPISSLGTLKAEIEVAMVDGTTSITGSPAFPEHHVTQLGAAARVGLDAGTAGAVLDFLFASGDQNIDDGSQNGFRADPNFDMGMLLYRQVLTAQTGRGVATASDPDLVGYPTNGIERFATRGSITNTIAFFPRAFWRPVSGLEIYGGPLLAFNAANNIDPLNTRLAGGSARNALNAAPGRYLGTELDLGVRYRALFGTTELTAGAEFGVLQPGSALNNDHDNPMRPVYGARGVLQYRL